MGHAFLCFTIGGSVPEGPYVFFTMIFNGAYSVDLFFVLSGFVLINTTTAFGAQTYIAFIARRALRIYPAAWVSLIFSAMAIVIVPAMQLRSGSSISQWAMEIIGKPPASIRHLVGTIALTDYTLNPILWTIAIELAASVGYPIFVTLVQRQNALAALLLTSIALVVSAYVPGGMALAHVPHYMFMFMVGACLNFLKPRQEAKGRNWAIFIGLGLMLESRLYGQIHSFASDAISVVSASLVIGSVAFWCPPWLERVLGSSKLVKLGQASYSYYLINPVVLFVLVQCCPKLHIDAPSNVFGYVLYSLSLGIMVAVVSAFPAVMLARYVESPSIRVGRRVERYILALGNRSLGCES